MIFAKNKKTAAYLSREIAEKRFVKTYLAVIEGTPEEKDGHFEDLLFKDKHKNKSYVVKRERKGVRRASLDYRAIGESDGKTLVSVRLNTGRSHQIRVQLSHAGLPIWGDARYGGGKPGEQIALWGAHLGLIHPTKKEEMRFDALPPMDAQPWKRFGAAVWAREGKIFL